MLKPGCKSYNDVDMTSYGVSNVDFPMFVTRVFLLFNSLLVNNNFVLVFFCSYMGLLRNKPA